MHIKIEQNMPRIKALGENIAALGDAINAEELKKEVAELDNRTAAPDFWNDVENSQKVLKQLKAKKSLLDGYITLSKSYDDLTTLIDMIADEEDDSYAEEVITDLSALEKQYAEEKISVMLSGQYDANNAILSIHPGAGGTVLRTGLKCFTVCTAALPSVISSRSRCLTILMAKKPE